MIQVWIEKCISMLLYWAGSWREINLRWSTSLSQAEGNIQLDIKCRRQDDVKGGTHVVRRWILSESYLIHSHRGRSISFVFLNDYTIIKKLLPTPATTLHRKKANKVSKRIKTSFRTLIRFITVKNVSSMISDSGLFNFLARMFP